VLDAPGQKDAARVEVPAGGGALVGRDPSGRSSHVDDPRLQDLALNRVEVATPSVSTHHALIIDERDVIRVCDLGSKNGTWVQVPPQGHVLAPAGSTVRVRLGGGAPAVRDVSEPEEPQLGGSRDAAEVVAESVDRWLARRSIPARARLLPRTRADGARPFAWPLGRAGQLVVEFDQTVDAEVVAEVGRLAGWVARHDALLRAERDAEDDGLILASLPMRRAHRAVVAHGREGVRSVVLLGPTGVGKERFARAFHRASARRDGPFVPVNCAGLSPALVEAELFGAVEGAYTGAVRTTRGAVERADGGTLFLDEIGEMPEAAQAQMLRFLDGGGEYTRLGERGLVRHADVLLVSATNRPVLDSAPRGFLRKDLWYRIAERVLELPPLRQRREDIAAYLEGLTLGACSAREALSDEAWAALCAHAWEGNFRELVHFGRRLPRAAERGSLGAQQVRDLLALRGPTEAPDGARGGRPELPEGAWRGALLEAADRFKSDELGEAPATWTELVTFIERYLKPVAVRGMVAALEREGGALSTREVAERLGADAKTIAKHLGQRGAR
jgi:DNA-binding NtrC family response regulator